MASDILSNPPAINYHEEAIATNLAEFEKVVRSRRSVRVFEAEKIPDDVVRKCIDLALLAPNSSNLQPWEFYWIKNPEIKKKLDEACFGQSASKTAPTLVVCVSRTDTWKRNSLQMSKLLREGKAPASAIAYYENLVPVVYGWFGPLGILSPFKWLFFTLAGFFRVVPRDPMSKSSLESWAHKSTALACENLMLAFRAAGYDSCPMEGFDEWRVRRALNLPRSAHVTMIVSAGKRKKGGIYGQQIRLNRAQFVFEV